MGTWLRILRWMMQKQSWRNCLRSPESPSPIKCLLKKIQIILCQIIYGWQQIFLIISIHSHSQWILCKETAKKNILPSRFLARTAEAVAVFAEWLYKSGTKVPQSCPSSKFLKVCIRGRELASFTFLVIIHLREIAVSKILQILTFLCNVP